MTEGKLKSVPFNFVLEELFPLELTVRPMFGCHAVYVGDKIVLVLRNKEDHPADNGIWVATKKEFHASLQPELPSMRSISFLGKAPTNWQNIPSDSADFEECALKACMLIKKGDLRIGHKPSKKQVKRLI